MMTVNYVSHRFMLIIKFEDAKRSNVSISPRHGWLDRNPADADGHALRGRAEDNLISALDKGISASQQDKCSENSRGERFRNINDIERRGEYRVTCDDDNPRSIPVSINNNNEPQIGSS